MPISNVATPAQLSTELGRDHELVWATVADAAVACDGVLMGGTALAVRIGHRPPTDFDVFCLNDFYAPKVVAALKRSPLEYYPLLVRFNSVNATLGNVFVQVNKERTGEATPTIRQIAEPTMMEGMPVGSLADVFASKLNAVRFRSTERDLIDVAATDIHGELPIEDGIACHTARYRVRAGAHIFHRLTSLTAEATRGTLEKGETSFPAEQIAAAAETLRTRLPDIAQAVNTNLGATTRWNDKLAYLD